MILSSCAGAGPKAEEKIFVEDTLAHEELFGETKSMVPGIRKLAPVDSSAPAVGVQSKVDDKGTADESDDEIAIRFVAAVRIKEGNLSNTTATWTREVHYARDWYDQEGKVLRASSDVECTKAYTSITDGGAALTISAFNSAVGGGANYTHFVAYTMRAIPLATYHNCYIFASLSIDNEGDNSFDAESRIVAARMDGEVKFSFDSSANDFFLAGTIGGAPNTVAQDGVTRGDGNAASFTTDLSANDSFVIVQKDASIFKVWDGSRLMGEYDAYFAKENNRIKAKSAGNYRFYLNTSNEIFATAPCSNNVETDYYLRGSMTGTGWAVNESYRFKTNGDWNNQGVLLNVHILKDGEFKIANSTWNYQWGYWGYQLNGGDIQYRGVGNANIIGGGSSHFEANDSSDNPKNIKCKDSGYYNFFLTDLNYLSVEVVSLD